MSTTLLQLRNRLRRHLGDGSGITWTNTQIYYAIIEAIEQAWPYFYEPVADESSFTGASALAANTTEISVPTAFLASGTRGNGAVFSVWARMTNGTETGTIYKPWFRLTRGVRMDNLEGSSPKIRFTDPELCASQCELKLYGGRPIASPVGYDFTAAASTDIFNATGADLTNGNTVNLDGSLLPTGVSGSTEYYCINSAGPLCKLSTTLGGTAINITADGSGTLWITSQTLTQTGTTGYVSYLLYAASAFLHESREKGQAYDRRGHSRRGLMASQKAEGYAKRYRMARPFETRFDAYGSPS
jgi:hypothetical protein